MGIAAKNTSNEIPCTTTKLPSLPQDPPTTVLLGPLASPNLQRRGHQRLRKISRNYLVRPVLLEEEKSLSGARESRYSYLLSRCVPCAGANVWLEDVQVVTGRLAWTGSEDNMKHLQSRIRNPEDDTTNSSYLLRRRYT